MKYLAPAFCAMLLIASAAAAQPQCLQQNRVNGWKVVDDQTLIVSDRLGHQFTVSLAKGCHDLKWPIRLGFSTSLGGLSCIGRHDFVLVPPGGGSVSQRCMIEDVQPYGASSHTPAGQAALNQH